ncbi:Bax inhibitor-1 family protein [Halocynthiibacter namhaensis]|uniref:Bax inhibitor-1/YccA family protein n=1 Tax=Halocynthiibacter namhaensis TaxID=1290553 RepID=UPI00057928FA|nr:Bax inhibitor-1/YccA family protein [Halocynthiibacter namhaensis]
MATYHQSDARVGARAADIDAGLRAHMNKVYGTMSIGMLITALAAWAVAGLAVTSDPTGTTYMLREGQFLTGFGEAIYASPLKYAIMFGPLAFLFFGWGALMNRASSAGVQLGFFVFASVIGLSMSSIFLVYTGGSIVQTFLVTSIAFGSLSLYGYVTKRDLSAMGGFLMMGVVGLLIAMILNMFMQSGVLTLAISAIGVVLFAGLTAYYTQDIKNTYVAHAMHGDQEWLNKAAIDGAMSLYLAFLNMFQFLLMFLGQQD